MAASSAFNLSGFDPKTFKWSPISTPTVSGLDFLSPAPPVQSSAAMDAQTQAQSDAVLAQLAQQQAANAQAQPTPVDAQLAQQQAEMQKAEDDLAAANGIKYQAQQAAQQAAAEKYGLSMDDPLVRMSYNDPTALQQAADNRASAAAIQSRLDAAIARNTEIQQAADAQNAKDQAAARAQKLSDFQAYAAEGRGNDTLNKFAAELLNPNVASMYGTGFTPEELQQAAATGHQQYVDRMAAQQSSGGGGLLNHWADAIGGGLADLDSSLGLSKNAPIIAAIGITLATAGAGAEIGAALLDSGVVSSAAVADAAGTAIVNAGMQVAQGVPLDKALENGALSVITSQYVTPAISDEVKSVIDNPLAQKMATNAGTTIATGAITGKSGDQIAKSVIGSATGALAGAAGSEVGKEVLANIDDPTIAKIAADAARAGTTSALLGQDAGKAALNAGATTAAHSDLGLGDSMPNLTSGLPSIDMSGIKDAVKPISDALTSVAQPISDAVTKVTQPLEQPIKDVAQAGSDAVTQVTQPVEGALKDAYQAGSDLVQKGSDAVTQLTQPVEGALKDAYQAGSDKLSDLTGNLPSISAPDVTLPKITGGLPTVKVTQKPTTTTPTTTPTKTAASTPTNPFPQTTASTLTPHFVTSSMPSGKTADILEKMPQIYESNGFGFDDTPQAAATGGTIGGLPTKYAEAAPKGHKPEFITGVTGYYAQGGGTGQSDDIPAMLHDGDYVIDAEAVSALGDGSSKAGAEALAKFQSQFPHRDTGPEKGKPVAAKIADGEYVFPAAFVTALGGGDNKKGAKLLDAMRVELRIHKRAAPTSKIPPKAESPLDYLKMAKG